MSWYSTVARAQFPGFVSLMGIDQCGVTLAIEEPSHGSRNPFGGGSVR